MKDLLIDVGNPAAFDRTIQSFGAALIEEAPGRYIKHNGHYVLRVLGDADYVKFVIAHQGYGKVVGEKEN